MKDEFLKRVDLAKGKGYFSAARKPFSATDHTVWLFLR